MRCDGASPVISHRVTIMLALTIAFRIRDESDEVRAVDSDQGDASPFACVSGSAYRSPAWMHLQVSDLVAFYCHILSTSRWNQIQPPRCWLQLPLHKTLLPLRAHVTLMLILPRPWSLKHCTSMSLWPEAEPEIT